MTVAARRGRRPRSVGWRPVECPRPLAL